MTTLLEDSPRPYQVGWISEVVSSGDSSAAVITPWASPHDHRGGSGNKPGLGHRTRELQDANIPFWFDPMTHALQMTGVGDFRYYSGFNLWGGPLGDLTTDANRREHVRRVFRLQDEIGATHLAPAPLLTAPLSNLSTLALETARVAIETDPNVWLTIAGTSTFWGDGSDLDAHIGALAALQPAGWFISFVQPENKLPPRLSADEVFGVVRSVRALSEYQPVHMSHGDFAGLPGIAAGAQSVGTGWDKRQRVVAFSDYAARLPAGGMASWYERPTLLGLLGTLENRDGALLGRQAPALASRLGGLPIAPGPKESFMHHVAQLNAASLRVMAVSDYESRYRVLDEMYTEAATNWAAVRAATGIRDGAATWVAPFQRGLRMYAQSEGWIT